MPDFRLGGPYLDFNVVAKPGKAVHQLALGQIAEVAAHHVGNFGLRDAHHLGSLLLCETPAAHGLPDLDDQAGFDLELFCVS